MALVSRIPTSSPTSIESRRSKYYVRKPGFEVRCTPQSQKASPFTEKHSIERYHRDSWLYNAQLQEPRAASCPLPSDENFVRDYDIALQLPELRKLLDVLREKREAGNGGQKRGPGSVFLVGTGPGDPELLTLKALRVIQGADLLLYDRLVSNDVLNLVGPDARLLYVGKTAGYHSRTQVGLVSCLYLSMTFGRCVFGTLVVMFEIWF